MRVSFPQLIELLDRNKSDPQFQRALLRKVFSYPENIDTFSYYCFPNAITSEVPKFHMDIYKKLFSSDNYALAAPRGHGKSTVTGLVFITFCVVNNLEKYIVYVSQNHAKTIQFIQPLRDAFKNNERLRSVYGNLSPTKAKDDDGRDREDCIDVNGIRIEAVSFEKNLRGFKFGVYRPSLIIGDDIEDDMRVINPELRDKDKSKLNKVIIPALSTDGRFKMIGTILHNNSLLVGKIQQYGGNIYRAYKDDGSILMPGLWSKELLDKKRLDIGSLAFQQEYLNDPRDNETNLIKKEWIDDCKDRELSFEKIKTGNFTCIYGGVDFAFSDRITADKSAFCSVGLYDDKYYLAWCDYKKGMSVLQQFSYIKNNWNIQIQHDTIGIEENSIRSISDDVLNQADDINFMLFWTGSRDSSASRGNRRTVGKFNLITRLATIFENRKIVLPYKTEEDRRIVDQLAEELMSFALVDGKLVEAGVHPDIPIALAYALELHEDNKGVLL